MGSSPIWDGTLTMSYTNQMSNYGALAHLVECSLCKREVQGSKPNQSLGASIEHWCDVKVNQEGSCFGLPKV